MPKKRKDVSPAQAIASLRMPRGNEVLGITEQLVGFDRLRVRCKDGHTRMCRIPGKIRKRMWVRENDVVVVRPWVVQSNEKGDVVYRYTRTQVGWLAKRGVWD